MLVGAQGFVVGARGSKVFCLHYLAMSTVNVPQSSAMYRYLEKKSHQEAYDVACMGVTDSDWAQLAYQSLMALHLDVAVKAFIRIRDVRFVDLINRLKASRKQPGHDDRVFLAEAIAFRCITPTCHHPSLRCNNLALTAWLQGELSGCWSAVHRGG